MENEVWWKQKVAEHDVQATVERIGFHVDYIENEVIRTCHPYVAGGGECFYVGALPDEDGGEDGATIVVGGELKRDEASREASPNELGSAIALFLADIVGVMSVRWKEISD